MNNVYSNSNDHDVKAVVLYGKKDDRYVPRLYLNEECAIAAPRDVVMDLFIKNILIIYDVEKEMFVLPNIMSPKPLDDGSICVSFYVGTESVNYYSAVTEE